MFIARGIQIILEAPLGATCRPTGLECRAADGAMNIWSLRDKDRELTVVDFTRHGAAGVNNVSRITNRNLSR